MAHILDDFDENCFDMKDHIEFLVPHEEGRNFNFPLFL